MSEPYLSMLEEGVLQWMVERKIDLGELRPSNQFTVTPLRPEDRWKPGDPIPKNLGELNPQALECEPENFVMDVHFEAGIGQTGWRIHPPWSEIKVASITEQCDLLVRLVCQYGFTFEGTA